MADTAQGKQHAFISNGIAKKDLGTLGGNNSIAYGVNIRNQVVDQSDMPNGKHHAFMWSGSLKDLGSSGVASNSTTDNSSTRDLGTLGGANSTAYAINDIGQVVGVSDTGSGQYHAFLWDNGKMTDLGILGGPNSWAQDINNLSQIIGGSCLDSNCGYYVGFFYDKGKMINTGTLGWGNSSANGINSTGTAVLWSNGGGGDVEVGVYMNGVLATIGSNSLGPDTGIGAAHPINDAGKIAGGYQPGGPGTPYYPFYYDGTFQKLSFANYSQGFLESINNAKTMSGWGILKSNGKTHAILVKP